MYKSQYSIEDEDADDLVAAAASHTSMLCTILTVSAVPHHRMTEEVLPAEVERH